MLRACSFNPELYLVPLRNESGEILHHPNGDVIMTLPIEAHLHWFNTWCIEEGVEGHLDTSELEILATLVKNEKKSTFVCVKAKLYINGRIAGISAAGDVIYDDNYDGIDDIYDKAIKCVLKDAGFTAGYDIEDVFLMYPYLLNNSSNATKQVDLSAIKKQPEPKSLEEAKAFIWNIRHRIFKGKTLEEMWASEQGRNTIFTVSKNSSVNEKNKAITTACRIMVNEMSEK